MTWTGVPHVQAIHRLVEAVARATDPGRIPEEALDVLIATLGADRAAVLLFDEHGIMRFTAWRGLSDEYRRATEGHSPWSADATDPAPVLVPDVLDDPDLAALRDVIVGEGIRSLAFIPLVSGGRLLGKFMVYFDQPHAYTEDDVDVARAIAAQVAFAIDKERLENDLRLANRALTATLDAVPDGITVQAPDGTLLFANDNAAAMTGFDSPAQLLGAGPQAVMDRFEVFEEDGTPVPLWDLPGRQALLGRESPARLIRYRTKGQTDFRWSLVSARPVFTDDGTVRFVVNVFRDVTERQRAAQALQDSERRLSFLSATSQHLLGSALDYTTILERVAELFVPDMADFCAVRELAPDGSVGRAAIRHTESFDPTNVPPLEGAPDPRSGDPLLDAVQRGESLVVPNLGRTSLQSALVVPMLARGRAIGAISLVTGPGGRRYDDQDLALVEEVARRAGLAVENARLFEERSTVASTLQRALLPPALPAIEGVELAARYRAAASDIGGDFYDVVRLGPSRWLIAVGDVCGKGIEAASLTAMVRYTLRAFAPYVTRPADLLGQLNDALLRQMGADRFCTVACAILDRTPERTRVSIALGGHPQPLLVRPGGRVYAVGRPGTLLGTLSEPDLADHEIDLDPGAALVIFTDGCLGENPTGSDEDRLAATLRAGGATGAGAAWLAEAVEASAMEVAEHTDDLTVLVCRRTP